MSSPCSFKSLQNPGKIVLLGIVLCMRSSMYTRVLNYEKSNSFAKSMGVMSIPFRRMFSCEYFGTAITCIKVGSVYPPDCVWVICKDACAPERVLHIHIAVTARSCLEFQLPSLRPSKCILIIAVVANGWLASVAQDVGFNRSKQQQIIRKTGTLGANFRLEKRARIIT